jgi:hypothetical protein
LRAAPVKNSLAPEAGAAMHVVADQQVLQHGGVFEQFDVLEGACDAQFGHPMRGRAGERRSVEVDGARGRGVDAADQVEDRGLAGAVGADQREDLACGARRSSRR